MKNQSVEPRLIQTREVIQRKNANGTKREQDHRAHVTRRMLHHLRGSMHQTKDKDTDLRNIIRIPCGVGFVEKIIPGETAHNSRVVGLRYTVHRRHRVLEMLVRVYHVFMQHWIKNRQSIRHLLLKWTISFLIKLFLF